MEGRLTARDGNLRDRRRVQRPLDALDALVEDARDAVRLDENCAVADAEAEADADAKTRARQDIRRREDDEGHAVAAQDPGEQHVAELSARSLDDGRFVVSVSGREGKVGYRLAINFERRSTARRDSPDKNACREDGKADTERGKDERDERPRRKPIDDFGWNLIAAGDVDTRPPAGPARHARIVERVGVEVALHAHPAALILEVADRPGRTGLTAHRLWLVALPLQRLNAQVEAAKRLVELLNPGHPLCRPSLTSPSTFRPGCSRTSCRSAGTGRCCNSHRHRRPR